MAAKAPSTAIGAVPSDTKLQQQQRAFEVTDKVDSPSLANFDERRSGVRKAFELELNPKQQQPTRPVTYAAAAAAAASAKPAPASASGSASDAQAGVKKPRYDRVPQPPKKLVIDQPVFAHRNGAGKYVTFVNRIVPKRPLPLGLNSFSAFEHIYRAMTGAQTDANAPKGVFSVDAAQFLKVSASDKCVFEDGSDSKSGNALIGSPWQIMAVCSHDAIAVLQLAACLTSKQTPVSILLPPTPTSQDTFFDRLNAACPEYINANVALWKHEDKVADGSKDVRVIPHPKTIAPTQSMTETLRVVLDTPHNDTVLFWDAPDWFDPTEIHYPQKKESYADVLLSDVILNKCSAVLLTQRAYWLEQIGTEERKRLGKHWDLYAQVASGIPTEHSEVTDETKALQALLAANDAAVAGKSKPTSNIKSLMDAAFQMHTTDHARAAREIRRKARRITNAKPDAQRQALFGKGMKALEGRNAKCFFILVRKQVVAAASVAAAAAR
jgi:hypothetical protein